MTQDERTAATSSWRTGLDEQLAVLGSIGDLVAEQQQASEPPDFPTLSRIIATRQTLVTRLASLAARLRPIRETLSSERDDTQELADLLSLQRVVTERAQAILAADRRTIDVLVDAQQQGLAEAHDLHSGGRTLAAYRRVTSPSTPASTLFTQRG